MKIAIVTGTFPPGTCGVGDYTARLAEALGQTGLDVGIIDVGDWRMRGALKTRNSLQKYDLVHIQYPTPGSGYRLGPHALSLLRNCVVTIHEASQRRILRKLSLLPFMVRPRHVIFTSDFERRYVTGWVPWVARISSIVPIPSNIRSFPQERPRTISEIVYFGLILPRKGLEQVVEMSRLIKSMRLDLKVRIIGKSRPEHLGYLEVLRSLSAELPIIWDLDLSEDHVAEKLASSAVAYLPFPDGASERRSSLKAALVNGVAVITTKGEHTPESMNSVVRFSEGPGNALVIARSLLQRIQDRADLAKNAAEFLQQCTWDRVAELHLGIYRSLLRSERSPAHIGTKDAQEEP